MIHVLTSCATAVLNYIRAHASDWLVKHAVKHLLHVVVQLVLVLLRDPSTSDEKLLQDIKDTENMIQEVWGPLVNSNRTLSK